MTPQEVVKEEIVKMLEKDFDQLQKLIDYIVKTKNLDRKKVGEAYFLAQKIDMELYRLILSVT